MISAYLFIHFLLNTLSDICLEQSYCPDFSFEIILLQATFNFLKCKVIVVQILIVCLFLLFKYILPGHIISLLFKGLINFSQLY